MAKRSIEELKKKRPEVGNLIREGRRKMNLSLKELSERVDLSYTYLSKIENNRIIPSLKVIEKLSEELNLRVWDLFFSWRLWKVFDRAKRTKPKEVPDPDTLMRPYRHKEDFFVDKQVIQMVFSVLQPFGLSLNNARQIAEIIVLLKRYEPEEMGKRIEAIKALLEPVEKDGEKNGS